MDPDKLTDDELIALSLLDALGMTDDALEEVIQQAIGIPEQEAADAEARRFEPDDAPRSSFPQPGGSCTHRVRNAWTGQD